MTAMIDSRSETWDVEAAPEMVLDRDGCPRYALEAPAPVICVGCGHDFTRVALIKFDGQPPRRYECTLCTLNRADAEFERAVAL